MSDLQRGIEVARHGKGGIEHVRRRRGTMESRQDAPRPRGAAGTDDEHRHPRVTEEPLTGAAIVAPGKVAAEDEQIRLELGKETVHLAPWVAHTHVEPERLGAEGGCKALERIHGAALHGQVPTRNHPGDIDAGLRPGKFPGPPHRSQRWRPEINRNQYLPKVHGPSLMPGGLRPPLHSKQDVVSGMALSRANGIGVRQAIQVP
ncbi:MAG TPA: hypothetical protein VFT04_11045 [Gemmatimonadales bacterium]|nr:hypothetical protein [Gemmatimonadales bacterium]